jgi:hypothetical protein
MGKVKVLILKLFGLATVISVLLFSQVTTEEYADGATVDDMAKTDGSVTAFQRKNFSEIVASIEFSPSSAERMPAMKQLIAAAAVAGLQE